MPSYNLLDQPWIPVIDTANHRGEISLLSLFADPSRYTTLDIADPLEHAAVMRTLLAIMYRVHQGGLTTEQANRLHKEGHDPAIIDYLTGMRPRFDLKNPEKPFLQTPGMKPASKNPQRDLSLLHPAMKNQLWTPRNTHGRLTPAEAARLLLVSRNYDGAGIHTGMLGDPKANGPRSMAIGVAAAGQMTVCVMHGEDLWETLLMNTPTTKVNGPDLPMWELDVEHVGPMDIPPTGPALSYTWPSRRILLLWDGDGMCDGAWQTNGDRTPWYEKSPFQPTTDPNLLEPDAWWKPGDKENTWMSRSVLDSTRPLWTHWKDVMGVQRPPVIDHALAMRGRALMDTVCVRWGQNNSKIAGVLRHRYLVDGRSVGEEAVRALAKHARNATPDVDRRVRAWIAGESEEL